MTAAVVAPGKLFVVGEYAVLAGARALVAALDAGIRCIARPSDRGWRIEAPDLGLDLSLPEAVADRHGALLAAAADAALRHFGNARPLRLRIEGTHAAMRAKRGLGGSAASVVALVAALAADAGEDPASEPTRQTIFRLARSVQLQRQRGRGSGADVAASVWGGWIDFALDGGVPRARPAPVPGGLALCVAWSGIARDTTAALDGWAGNGGLAEPLARFWQALAVEDRPGLLRALGDYGDALGFGEGPAGARLASLVSAARAAGAAAKGSGAVGGDCVIALSFEPEVLAAAEARWRALGAEVLDVSAGGEGVRREEAVV